MYNPPAPVGFSYTRTLGLKDDRVFFKRGHLFFKRGHLFFKRGHLFLKRGHLFLKRGHVFKKDGHLFFECMMCVSFPDFSRRFFSPLGILFHTGPGCLLLWELRFINI